MTKARRYRIYNRLAGVGSSWAIWDGERERWLPKRYGGFGSARDAAYKLNQKANSRSQEGKATK